ncbi:hypothetical protein PLEOSDRAFT_170308 [Pleurotus ostreatus PC15]|uniref:Uncharacterized protein n=1 Tax=Pleurotus ostreatus (strain PC15) TaxID=1137138 RepID=A0A067NKU5_PLEO1|nr:hypothetical protein PLEOSDRAFT_170308 [Pleurotus ostreatus PC15]
MRFGVSKSREGLASLEYPQGCGRRGFSPGCPIDEQNVVDPKTFTPQPGPKGEIHAWGVYAIKYQHLYMSSGKRKPEEQFVDVLMERKVPKEQLKRTNLGTLPKQDVIVKIYLAHLQDSTGQPRVWRRFRVSAGIKLSVLQDKAIAPVMVGYGTCTLTRSPIIEMDPYMVLGSVLVQMLDESRAVVMAHVAQAHVFGKEGDKIGICTTLGINVPHVSVRGRVNAADYVGKQAKKRETLDSPNYEGFGKPPALFDVTHFDINAAHEGLSAALASTNSVRSGAKTYTMPLHPDAMNTNIDQLKKGQSMVRDFSPDSHGYWQETTSTKKDKKSETVCGLCDIAHLRTKRNIGNQPIGNNAAGSTSKRSDPHATIRG